jgi:cytochrome c biogenesis protein CcmG, thiol:disulfide interchange protein DsbE
MGMKRGLIWLPLALFALLFGVVASGLVKPTDHVVHSGMVGKPVPKFSLPPIIASKPGLGSAVLEQGQPRLLNIFASWCIPCIAEAPQLVRIKAAGVPIEGIAIRDTGPAIADFLKRNGDPYERIGSDVDSSVQIALGSSGVPESFVVDGHGKIVLQHVGDIRAEDVAGIVAAVKSAQ